MNSFIQLVVAAMAFVTMTEAVAAEISVERGRYLTVIASCHDCHTEGYTASNGVIDPDKAFKGSTLGWRGPWGTTYAPNVRLWAADLSEDGFLLFVTSATASPPMPWYNLRAMQPDDLRSVYRYIRSLGEPGKQAPTMLQPGAMPRTAYIDLEVRQPPPCRRDLDCGIGEVCSTDEPRQCVKR